MEEKGVGETEPEGKRGVRNSLKSRSEENGQDTVGVGTRREGLGERGEKGGRRDRKLGLRREREREERGEEQTEEKGNGGIGEKPGAGQPGIVGP